VAFPRPLARAPFVILAITLAWLAIVAFAPRIELAEHFRAVALFGHLVSLLIGFGAVLAVEWVGLLWLLRKRPLAAVLDSARTARLPIWGGLIGLGATGLLLHPDVTSTFTRIKLAAVLILALNGLYAAVLERRLTTARPGRSLMFRLFVSTAISQTCWWGATVIGFLNSQRQ